MAPVLEVRLRRTFTHVSSTPSGKRLRRSCMVLLIEIGPSTRYAFSRQDAEKTHITQKSHECPSITDEHSWDFIPLNPCFSGRWSLTLVEQLKQVLITCCLNPCFSGRWSLTLAGKCLSAGWGKS